MIVEKERESEAVAKGEEATIMASEFCSSGDWVSGFFSILESGSIFVKLGYGD